MIEFIQGNSTSLPFPDKYFHCVVTSPPYWGLRSYLKAGDSNKEFELGCEPTPELYVEHIVQVFREIWRVLRDDGTVWLNLGDSYIGSGGAGGDYAEGGLREGQPRWKNSFEVNKSKREVKRWGGGNIPPSGCLKPKDLAGIPWRVAFALQTDGWYLRKGIIWFKKNPMPESVRDRPTKSHEDVFLLSKQATYYYDADAIREPNITQVKSKRQKGGAKNIQGNMSERGVTRTTEGLNLKSAEEKQNPQGRNKRDVWEISTRGYKGAHFAVMPEKLAEPCVLAGTSAKGCCPKCGKPWKRIINKVRPELRKIKGAGPHGDHGLLGGNRFDDPIQVNTIGWQATCKCDEEPIPCRVLDPFSGAGTVGVVCARYGRSFMGVDLNPEYIDLARQRVDKIQMRFIP